MTKIHRHRYEFRTPVPPLTPAQLASDDALRFYCRSNHQVVPVLVTWNHERVTGSKVTELWTKSEVPRSVAAVVNYIQPVAEQRHPKPGPIFLALVRVQPEYAARIFARRRSDRSLMLSILANDARTGELLNYWARRFADMQVREGREREACLNAGSECFTAYLSSYDFGGVNLANVNVFLTQIRNRFPQPPYQGNLGAEVQQQEEATVRDALGQQVPGVEPGLHPLLALLENLLEPASSYTSKNSRFSDLAPDQHNSIQYSAAIFAMVATGAALYCREKVSLVERREDRARFILALAGGLLGIFPPAAGVAGFGFTVGSTIIKKVSDHRIRHYKDLQRVARRIADSMILDRLSGTREFGEVTLAALNSVF